MSRTQNRIVTGYEDPSKVSRILYSKDDLSKPCVMMMSVCISVHLYVMNVQGMSG